MQCKLLFKKCLSKKVFKIQKTVVFSNYLEYTFVIKYKGDFINGKSIEF